jgi:hypothetical protein
MEKGEKAAQSKWLLVTRNRHDDSADSADLFGVDKLKLM